MKRGNPGADKNLEGSSLTDAQKEGYRLALTSEKMSFKKKSIDLKNAHKKKYKKKSIDLKNAHLKNIQTINEKYGQPYMCLDEVKFNTKRDAWIKITQSYISKLEEMWRNSQNETDTSPSSLPPRDLKKQRVHQKDTFEIPIQSANQNLPKERIECNQGKSGCEENTPTQDNTKDTDMAEVQSNPNIETDQTSQSTEDLEEDGGEREEDLYKLFNSFFPCKAQWAYERGAGSCMPIAVKVAHVFMIAEIDDDKYELENHPNAWDKTMQRGIELFSAWKAKYEKIKMNRKDISPYAEINDVLQMHPCKEFVKDITLVRQYTSELPYGAAIGSGYTNKPIEDAIKDALVGLVCHRIGFVVSIISGGAPYTICFCVYREGVSKKINNIYLFDSHGSQMYPNKSTLLKTKSVEAVCQFMKTCYRKKTEELKVEQLQLAMKTGRDFMDETQTKKIEFSIRYTMAVFVLSNSSDASETKGMIIPDDDDDN